MCELMAMSFETPVSADFSLREFAARGEENPDGWGLGWYPDRSLAIVKEPLKWASSRYAGFLETYPTLLSRIYLAHVRHKTMGGEPTHADTHPFHRERDGRDYCFAHNGTIDGPCLGPPARPLSEPLGDDRLRALFLPPPGRSWTPGAEATSTTRPIGAGSTRALASAPTGLASSTSCFSDGVRVFVYHDVERLEGPQLQEDPVPPGPAPPLRRRDPGGRP